MSKGKALTLEEVDFAIGLLRKTPIFQDREILSHYHEMIEIVRKRFSSPGTTSLSVDLQAGPEVVGLLKQILDRYEKLQKEQDQKHGSSFWAFWLRGMKRSLSSLGVQQ